MERARATWTDERLDDLLTRVEDGFNRIDQDLRELSGRIDARGAHMESRIDTQSTQLSDRIDAQGASLSGRIDAQTAELSRRLDALQRTMVQFGGGITLAILATLVSVITTRG